MEVLAVHQLKKYKLLLEKKKKEEELNEKLIIKESDINTEEINKIFGLPSPPSELFALGRDASCALWWTYDKNLLINDDDNIFEKPESMEMNREDSVATIETQSSLASITRKSSMIENVSRNSLKMSKKKQKQFEEEQLLKKKLLEEKEQKELNEILNEAKNKDSLKIVGWEILRFRKDPVRDLDRLSTEDSLLVSFNTVTGYGIWRLKGRTTVSKASQTQIIIDNLTNNYEYYFQICAINKKGIGLPSVASNIIFIEKELPLNWYRYYDKIKNKIFYTSIKSNRIYYDQRPENDPFFLDDDIYLQFVKINEDESKEIEENESESEYEYDTHNEEKDYNDLKISEEHNSLKSKKQRENNEKELDFLKTLFNDEMVTNNGIITCDKMLSLLKDELNFYDITKKYLLELIYIYNKYNIKNFYYQKFNVNTNQNSNNRTNFYDNIVKNQLENNLNDNTSAALLLNKPDFTIITTWIEFIEIILQIKTKTNLEISINKRNQNKKNKIIKRFFKMIYRSKNYISIKNINIFLYFYTKYKQYYLHNNILTYADEEKYGNWIKKFNTFINKHYYENILTGEIIWYLPSEIRFFLPKNLEKMLLKKFNYGQLNEFKKYFILFDIDNNGDLSFDEVKILFQKFIFRKDNDDKEQYEIEDSFEEIEEKKKGFFSSFSNESKTKKNISKNSINSTSVLSDEKLRELIKTVDKNNNGTIEFNEFCWMLYEIATKNEFIFSWDKVEKNGNSKSKEQYYIENEQNGTRNDNIDNSLQLWGKIGEKLSRATPLPPLPRVNSSLIQSHLDPVIEQTNRRRSLLARSSSSFSLSTSRRGSISSNVSSVSTKSNENINNENSVKRKKSIFSIFSNASIDNNSDLLSVENSFTDSPPIAKSRKKLKHSFQPSAPIAPEIHSFPFILSNEGSNIDLGSLPIGARILEEDQDNDALSAIYEESTVATA